MRTERSSQRRSPQKRGSDGGRPGTETNEPGGPREARFGPRAVIAMTALVAACSSEPVGIDPAGGGTLELVVDGLRQPVLVTHAPDDPSRLFVVEKPGLVRIVRGDELLDEPFLDIEAITSSGGERGLLGLAFHPDFAANGHFFVNHTDESGDTRILRFTVGATPDVADPASLEVVLEVDQPFSNHNGGHLAFGPDGALYIGLGDGGSGGDPRGHGQNPATLLGSMLRIDVDELPYAIPSDNPFVASLSAAQETWAFGLRNPWRFSFDRETGDLWIADVGQNAVEEISFQAAESGGGENYGWAKYEGSTCFADGGCTPAGEVGPIYEYSHEEGCSVTGGYVYRGSDAPDLFGRYFFADYCGDWIRSIRREGSTITDVFDHTSDFGEIDRIVSFGEGADGALYLVGIGGEVYRLVAGD